MDYSSSDENTRKLLADSNAAVSGAAQLLPLVAEERGDEANAVRARAMGADAETGTSPHLVFAHCLA